MGFFDRERYTNDWENDSELKHSIPLDDYIHNREVNEYGPCDDELGNDDNEAYDDF